MSSNFRLMLLMGPKIAAPVPRAVIESVTAVQVTTTAGQASGFQISFAVSKQSELTRTMLPAGYFDPERRVIILVIVDGLPTVLMDGLVTRQDVAPSNEPGGSTLTITGEDVSLAMDLEHERACFPAMPAQVRVALICIKPRYLIYGIIPAPVPPVLLDIPNPIDKIPIQTGTDLAYLQALAAEAGYVFYIEPGPAPGTNIAYWGPEVRIGLPQPALSINMDAETNVESLSFSFDGRARVQYTINVMLPVVKVSIPVPVPDVGLLRPPLALRPAIALRTEPLPKTAHRSPITAALLGLARTAQAADAISGQGRLDVLRYGHILKARRLVGVRGAGPAYNGLYYVKSVTHDLKPGEYKQNFTLARDGLISITPRVPT